MIPPAASVSVGVPWNLLPGERVETTCISLGRAAVLRKPGMERFGRWKGLSSRARYQLSKKGAGDERAPGLCEVQLFGVERGSS
jgi:hypothetical protein